MFEIAQSPPIVLKDGEGQTNVAQSCPHCLVLSVCGLAVSEAAGRHGQPCARDALTMRQ